MTHFRLLQHTVEIRTGSPELRQDLERIAADMMVDVTLGPDEES